MVSRLGGDDGTWRCKDFCAIGFGIAVMAAALLAQEGVVAMVLGGGEQRGGRGDGEAEM
jgi:hypothetical protein